LLPGIPERFLPSHADVEVVEYVEVIFNSDGFLIMGRR
jgi:hypothetical protein